jgi:hypothetical protein
LKKVDEAFQAACKAGNVDIIMMLHSRVVFTSGQTSYQWELKKRDVMLAREMMSLKVISLI